LAATQSSRETGLIDVKASRAGLRQILQSTNQEDLVMAEPATQLPATAEEKAPQRSSPVENLRREVDRLLEDFDRSFLRAPFGRSLFNVEPFLQRGMSFGPAPAVDIVEKDNAYDITAELPGMTEKDIEVKLTNGSLRIRGEKQEEEEQKEKNYYVQASFRVL
jgi:HSP20 family protein